MSKSIGNVVDPRQARADANAGWGGGAALARPHARLLARGRRQGASPPLCPPQVILGGKDQKKEPPFGADVLRLWVASVDYSSDVMIGGRIISQVRPGAPLGAQPSCPGHRHSPLHPPPLAFARAARWRTCTARSDSRCATCWATWQTTTPQRTPCRMRSCPPPTASCLRALRASWTSAQPRTRAFSSTGACVCCSGGAGAGAHRGSACAPRIPGARARVLIVLCHLARPPRACRVYQALQRFAVLDLSNFYLDVAKDRLYIRSPGAADRRACQTVLAAMLEGLLPLIAPLLPHMAEDAWQALPFATPHRSVFQAGWVHVPDEWRALPAEEAATWRAVLAIRGEINQLLERARGDKALGASLEAKVLLHVADPQLRTRLEALQAAGNGQDPLRYSFIVSQAELVDSAAEAATAPYTAAAVLEEGGEVAVGVARADGHKCSRCWNYRCGGGLTGVLAESRACQPAPGGAALLATARAEHVQALPPPPPRSAARFWDRTPRPPRSASDACRSSRSRAFSCRSWSRWLEGALPWVCPSTEVLPPPHPPPSLPACSSLAAVVLLVQSVSVFRAQCEGGSRGRGRGGGGGGSGARKRAAPRFAGEAGQFGQRARCCRAGAWRERGTAGARAEKGNGGRQGGGAGKGIQDDGPDRYASGMARCAASPPGRAALARRKTPPP